MSPHAVTPSAHETAAESKSYLAGKFAVTSNGFLPADAPPAALTDPYYASWEALAQHLPQLIRDGTLRQRVCALEVLSTDRLKTEAEWRRAYVILGFLTHGYVWGGCQASEVLPAAIAVPFVDVAEHLEVPPVLTYAASNLWNFSCRGEADFTDMGALRSQVTFTGTESESWFFMISVAMEAQAAALIGPVLRAVEAGVRGRDYARLAAACDALAAGIGRVGALLDRMYERCDPDVFYHQIRPFLAGSKNMEAAGLPRGVFYQEEAGDDPAAADGRGTWRQLRGGSNGQSSMIQFFDIVLGVEHTHEGNHTPHARTAAKASPNQQHQQPKPADEDQPRSFHEEVRDYMPGPHRRFLQHVGRQGSLRELAQQPAATEAQRLFAAAFTGATEALGRFRNKHIQIVTRYIVLPAKRAAMQAKSAATAASPPSSSHTGAAAAAAAVAGRHNLATSSAAASAGTDTPSQDEPELKGTGGTTLIPFLKQARDETFEAGVLRRS